MSRAAQRAVVRMLFDPQFAAAVRAAPDEVLADVPAPLRGELAALDDRALRLDGKRRARTLAILCEEWRVTTTLLSVGGAGPQQLEEFFASTPFHQAVAEDTPLPFAFAGFLADELALGRMTGPLAPEVLHLETALAHCRRASPDSPSQPPALSDETRLRRGSGVMPLLAPAGALWVLATIGAWLDSARCAPPFDEPPRLTLPSPDPTPTPLVAMRLDDGTTPLVTIDAALHAVLRSVPDHGATVANIVAEARQRGVGDPRPPLASLVDDELLVAV